MHGEDMTLCASAAPVLYAEQDLLSPPPGGTELPRMPSVVNDLLSASSGEERQRLVRAMLHAIGFEWLGYGTVCQHRSRSLPQSFFTSYGHPAWTRRYFDERYYEVDSRHQDAPCSSLPLLWDIDHLAASVNSVRSTPHRRRFLDDFRDSGIRSGVFFSLASPTRANERTVISLMSSSPNRQWIVDSVLGQALTLALSVHECLAQRSPVLTGKPGTGAGMPRTQQHILNYLIQGRSDKEIAYHLKLSEHTVDYHMRQLRRRFAARNRVQLVNAAIEAAA